MDLHFDSSDWAQALLPSVPTTRELPSTILLELDLDLPLTVLVVDQGGRPVPGVPLTLGPGNAIPAARKVLTGPDGRAHFSHLLALTRKKDRGRLQVRLALPLAQEVKAPVDLKALLLPIRLVLPPTGSVELRVTDGGRPLGERPTLVALAVAQRDSTSTSWHLARGGILLTGSKAIFTHVGVGLQLTAYELPLDRLADLDALADLGGRGVPDRVVRGGRKTVPPLRKGGTKPAGERASGRDLRSHTSGTARRVAHPSEKAPGGGLAFNLMTLSGLRKLYCSTSSIWPLPCSGARQRRARRALLPAR